MKPLVPIWLAGAAAILSPILLGASKFLHEPWSVVAQILSFVTAALAGLALPQIKFLEHKPLVSAALVPTFASASALLAPLSATLPGLFGQAVFVAALVCAFLAGQASPAPMVAPPPEPPPGGLKSVINIKPVGGDE